MDTNPAPRKLHLIDVENLSGHGELNRVDAVQCRSAYEQTGLAGPRDLIVVACNPFIGLEVGACWQPGRLLVRHGRGGADRALLDVVDHEQIERRFDHVVVASGDGGFVDAVVRLQAQGVQVTVVARRDALSRRLQLAASQVVFFSPEPVPTPTATRLEAA